MTFQEYIQFLQDNIKRLKKPETLSENATPDIFLKNITGTLEACKDPEDPQKVNPTKEQVAQLQLDVMKLGASLIYYPRPLHKFGNYMTLLFSRVKAGTNIEEVFAQNTHELAPYSVEEIQAELDEALGIQNNGAQNNGAEEDEEDFIRIDIPDDHQNAEAGAEAEEESIQGDWEEDFKEQDFDQMALEREANATLEQNPDLPGDSMLCVKYPALNPKGHYAEIDMKVGERMRRLEVVAAVLPPEQRQSIRAILNALRSPAPTQNPLLAQYRMGLNDYAETGKEHRLIERMRLVGNSKYNNDQKLVMNIKLDNWKEGIVKTEKMDQLDALLDNLEGLAGMRPLAEGDKDLNRLMSDMQLQPAPEEFRVDVAKVRLTSFEPVLECIQANRPENWGKPKKKWAPLMPEAEAAPTGEKATEATFREASRKGSQIQLKNMGALDRLTTFYAQHSVGPLVDRLLAPQTKGQGVNPLDLVVVAGRTGREILQDRKYAQAQLRASVTSLRYLTDEQWEKVTPQQLAGHNLSDHDIYLMTRNLTACETDPKAGLVYAKELLAAGLMTGQPATVYKVSERGLVTGQVVHLENDAAGYKPMERLREGRPVVSLWQRFAHKVFGAYKEEFEKISQYDAALRQQQKLDEHKNDFNAEMSEPEYNVISLSADDDDLDRDGNVITAKKFRPEKDEGVEIPHVLVDEGIEVEKPMTGKHRRNYERKNNILLGDVQREDAAAAENENAVDNQPGNEANEAERSNHAAANGGRGLRNSFASGLEDVLEEMDMGSAENSKNKGKSMGMGGMH